jgi:hypothetical protein
MQLAKSRTFKNVDQAQVGKQRGSDGRQGGGRGSSVGRGGRGCGGGGGGGGGGGRVGHLLAQHEAAGTEALDKHRQVRGSARRRARGACEVLGLEVEAGLRCVQVSKETCYRAKETYNMANETYDMAKETYNMTNETYNAAKETMKYDKRDL